MTENKKGTDYNTMCQLLVESDKDLQRILNKPDVRELLDQESLLIFGPSRTGKSTILARIKSDLTKEEFSSTMKKNNKIGETFTIEEIQIASGHKAVTTVPNVFIKGRNLVFDLAGFIDIDPEREAVISLLNNSLFPRLSTCKIIVVFDLSILIGNINLTLRKYYEEFIRLLTPEHFKSGIASCIFVFTKADIHAKKFADDDEETQDINTLIQIKLLKFAADAGMEDPDFGSFCGNIAKRFCIINYHEQDKSDIIQMIQKRLNNAKPIVSKGMIFSKISNHNILSEKVEFYIEEYKIRSLDHVKTIENINSEAAKEHKNLKIKITEINNNIRKTNKAISEAKNVVTTLNIDNASTNTLIENEKIKLKNLEEEKIQLQEKYQAFLLQLNNLEILNVVVLPSSDYKKTMGSKLQRVTTYYKKPSGANGSISVVILESKQYDVNKEKIDKCKNLKEFEDLKIPYIYSNGKRRQGDTIDIKIDININTDDRVKIVTKSTEEHTVLCLSNLKVVDLAQSDAMVGYFNILIDKNINSINDTRHLMWINEEKIRENKLLEEKTLFQIKQLEQLNLELKSAHESFATVFNLKKEEFIKLLEKEYEKTKALLNDATFNSTCDLSNILTAHKIESDVFKSIFPIRDRLINLNNNQLPYTRSMMNLNAEIDSLILSLP